MRVVKLEALVRCPQCMAGSTLALDDGHYIRCMNCKQPLPGAKVKGKP